MRISQTGVTTVLTTLLTTANAHSWIEQLTTIASNGTFVGTPGYPRGYVARTSPDFSDKAMTHILPTDGGEVKKSDMMCMDTQRKQKQADDDHPRLQTAAGSGIALRFQENGHVTLPETQKGKPKNRGTVYVYGTTEPKEDEKFLDIHKVWNEDGTGGDKRGVLLTKQNFDDGRCYQVNGGEISKNRQEKFPHQADQVMGADMWCQTDVGLPSDAPSGKPYTLYWVWDWPTLPGDDPSIPDGKPEIYTTCMDVDVTDSAETNMRVQSGYKEGQPLDKAAIPEQFAEMFKSGGGSQGAASSTGPSSGASSAPAGQSSAPAQSSAPVKPSAPFGQSSTPVIQSSLPESPASSPSNSPAKRQSNQGSSPASPPAGSATTPAVSAAHSSAARPFPHTFQARGSFVTRTKTVQPADCHQSS